MPSASKRPARVTGMPTPDGLCQNRAPAAAPGSFVRTSLLPALLLGALVAFLPGCSSIPFLDDDEDQPSDTADLEEGGTEQELYRTAQQGLRSGNYDEALKRLQLLESRFPFGRYGEQAQLETIYAHFMAFDADLARSAADRFIRLHPQHPRVDYAYYLKGLAAYNKDRGLLDRVLPTSLARRDPGAARQSFDDFSELLRRHPDSPYAADARQRMLFLRNVLAQSEVEVARYYIRRGALVAAANRGRYVIENYPQTPATPDALAIMIEAYARLGQPDLANDALRVLALNYPQYPAFDRNGDFVLEDDVRNQDRSWLNLVTLNLLDTPDPPPPLRVRQPEGMAAPAPAGDARPSAPATNEAAPATETEEGWLDRLWPF